MDLKELESGVNPKIHWYYQSKKIPLISFVKKIFHQKKQPMILMDVGSGSGFFMYELDEMVPEMIAKIYLVDIGYSDEEIASTKGRKIEKTKELPLSIENGIVVMMDVLEHLRDDYGMLRSIKEKSKGDNYFFITVPAFMSLWSGHDVYLGHYRRYTRHSLGKLIHESRFEYHNLYFIYGWIFALVWGKRKLSRKNDQPESDMKSISPVANGILKAICSLEMCFRKVNRIAGVTCVAEGKI